MLLFCKKWWIYNISSYYFKHKLMKLLSFKKCRMDNQIYVSQLSVSLFFYELLFKVKKIDLRLKKTLKLKFKLIFFNSVYPTRLCDTMPKYTIYLRILLVERLFKCSLGLILLLYPMASKTCLKIVLHFTLWDRNLVFLSHPSDTKIQTAIIRYF